MPPSAYRLAEPGDTLDRIMIYLSAAGVVLAASGLVVSRGGGLWPAALAVGLAALWYSATPGPTFDGWYGLGWRTICDPGRALRRSSCAACCGGCRARRHRRGDAVSRSGIGSSDFWAVRVRTGHAGLWIAALVLAWLRQFEIPGVEPAGYWPRWAMIWGMLALRPGALDRTGALDSSRDGQLAACVPLGAGGLARAGGRGRSI